MSIIKTYTGVMFDLDKFDKNTIRIADIAHALSNQCRYNGHCYRFYSVAEHCVRASRLPCNDLSRGHVLMHDASEAYMGDVVSPLKKMIPWYIEKENELIDLVYDRFCTHKTNDIILEDVHKCDKFMLDMEMSTLWNDEPGFGWKPEEAERRFILRYEELVEMGMLKRFAH